MKKIFILMVLAASYSAAIQAENAYTSNTTQENSWKNRDYQYNRGNILVDELPSNIKKYLEKNYPDHVVMISKLKGDGYYYVKIKYNRKANRPYYKNLVFNQNGYPVRG